MQKRRICFDNDLTKNKMHQQLRRLATAAAAWPRARFGRRKVEVTFPALGGAGFGCTTAANFYGVV